MPSTLPFLSSIFMVRPTTALSRYSRFETRSLRLQFRRRLLELVEMPRIIVVDNSPSLAGHIRARVQSELGASCAVATSLSELEASIADGTERFSAAVCGLVLADSSHGTGVDRLLAAGVPTIVFTGIREEATRRDMLAKRIVDYVYKDVPEAIDEVVTIVRRVLRNPGTRVLVVEDSLAQRQELAALLRRQNLSVVATPDPEEALTVLRQDDGALKLAMVDYFMPGMDGIALTRRMRELRPRGELAIIGLSVASDESLPVQFLKAGADDFLVKPFAVEALNTRVSLHLDMVETVAALHRQSTCDYLTGLSNRRLFFSQAPALVDSARRDREKVAVGMIDIDDFKAVNDRHGHEAGDAVLLRIAGVLQSTDPRPALAARFGGEEFCVLLTGEGDSFGYFDRIRRAVEADGVEADGSSISCTVSIGVATATSLDVDGLISAADRLLYHAKRKGKNRVEAQ